MLNVVGEIACTAVAVESDPWVTLDVTWRTRERAGTLYLILSGSGGGYVEFKVDSVSGALVEAIVVDDPPEGLGYESLPGDGETAGTTVLLELNLWSGEDPADRSLDSVVRLDSMLYTSTCGNVVTLTLSEVEIAEFLGAGPVRLGLSAGRELVCIVAQGDFKGTGDGRS